MIRKNEMKFPTIPVILIMGLFLVFGGSGFVQNLLYKLPDIIFYPYLFLEGDLSKLEIVMSEADFYKINFDSDNPARIDFDFKGNEKEAWIEYIFDSADSDKKSYKITAVRDDLFNGVKSVELIPAGNSALADLFSIYRAKKLGVLAPHLYFVSLVVNERPEGVYLVDEGWTKELLEVENLPDSSIIFNASIVSDSAELKAFMSIVAADDKIFEERIGTIFDLEKFYNWKIVETLAGSDKQIGSILVFNTATGKFEPALDFKSSRFSALSERILSIEKFKNEQTQRFKEYAGDERNLADDLDFQDKLYQEAKTDFFKDFSKSKNNLSLILKHRQDRRDLVSVFSDIENNLSFSGSTENAFDQFQGVSLEGSFLDFNDIFLSREEFLERNIQFLSGPGNSIILPSGQHIFLKSAIIPKNLKLIIRPGASLYLDKDISIISYSPVIAGERGGERVKIFPLNEHSSWGSFAVIGTKDSLSTFDNVDVRGGSGLMINGIIITGMAVFHEADAEIENSYFSESADDDALNLKYGIFKIRNSVFERTSADAIDLDFGQPGSVIENNKFYKIGYKIGGDGIDISQSLVSIKDNLISGCSDKGISVGEDSHPEISGNFIEKCDTGIAVKDLSKAFISDTVLKDNRIGLAIYQKKTIFGGGKAELSGVTFMNNKQETEIDSLSKLEYK